MSSKVALFFILALSLSLVSSQAPAAYERAPQKPAIVLAAFGTTEVSALQSILNVEKRVQAAFPGYDVHLAFTSNFIRDVWHKRAGDKKFRKQNPSVPEEIYAITTPLTTLAQIQEQGPRMILVQSLHITEGEEYGDLKSMVTQLAGIETMNFELHPFPWLALGEPALGNGGGIYLEKAVAALSPLAEEAKKTGATLVLMGHGNENFDLAVYGHLENMLEKTYQHQVVLGLVEGKPSFDDIIKTLEKKGGSKDVLLAPLMLVAGDHALNDMGGDDADSWASKLKAAGYQVSLHLKGLGSTDAWADLYVDHLKAQEKKLLEQKKK